VEPAAANDFVFIHHLCSRRVVRETLEKSAHKLASTSARMSKKKGPTSSDLRKVGNVKVPTDWQPFGGFEDLESDDDSEVLRA